MAIVFNSRTEPGCEILQEVWLKFLSVQAGVRGVNNDADWLAAMNSIFSAANWPGVNAASLTFLRSFFVQIVHITPPPGP